MVYLDTTFLVRMVSSPNLISPSARRFIGQRELRVSPMVVLELQFLYEIQRVRYSSGEIMKHASDEFGVTVCNKPFEAITAKALEFSWTHDPFDRLILAHAVLDHDYLIATDGKFHEHYKRVIW